MTRSINALEDGLVQITFASVLVILLTAFTVQSYFVYLHFFKEPEATQKALGYYHTEEENIAIGEVKNLVQIGALAGNRNLSFGVKNILEEYVVEKDLILNPYAERKIEVEILFLDVLSIQSNLSVFHKTKESVVIRLRGKLIKNNKVIKSVVVEESADEVSMSTVLIDEGGKFNQQNLSSALKKSCNTLVSKLL